MLILSESDILKAIDFNDLLKSAEQALIIQEEGDFFMPDRIHLEYKGNVQLLMPAFNNDHFATKLVSVFPKNVNLNKPSIYGTVTLNDGETGEPLALLNGSKVTALRTAAVGALGLAYTTPKNVSSLGLIGAGIQGFHQVLLACAVRNIQHIHILDPFNKDLPGYIQKLSSFLPDIEISICKDAHDLVQKSEAIITATTSLSPVIPWDKQLLEGKHFIGIGSYTPKMQEYPKALLGHLDQVFIDTPLACKESGDISVPLSEGLVLDQQIHTLGKLILGTIHTDTTKTTLFKSVGMALFDLIAAEYIYKNALERGIGQNVQF